MDKISQSWYEMKFELDFAVKRFGEFQDFFSRIMELRHPSDFARVCPWGNDGDWKNDGYLHSKQQIFQLYAPNELTKAKTLSKMEEDCTGAVDKWKSKIVIWTFVHNSREGVPPFVLHKMLDLEARHAGLSVVQWGYAELRSELFGLDENDIAALLGPAPTERSMMDIRYDDLRVVLASIPSSNSATDADIRTVPPMKLKMNGLSHSVQNLMLSGMQRAAYVGNFFEEWDNPAFGDQIAADFKVQYRKLREQGLSPDEIFHGLQVFAGGSQVRQPAHQSAVLAVLAYLFETCDIFERPTGEAPQ